MPPPNQGVARAADQGKASSVRVWPSGVREILPPVLAGGRDGGLGRRPQNGPSAPAAGSGSGSARDSPAALAERSAVPAPGAKRRRKHRFLGIRVKLAAGIEFDFGSPHILGDGFRAWIGGESGSGKSHAAASVVGQVLEQGGQCIILDSHGEYAPLVALTRKVTLVGYDHPRALALDPELLPEYLHQISNGRSVFFNLVDWTDTEPEALNAFVFPLLKGIYAAQKKQPRQTMLLVEEAHNFAPQSKYEGDAAKTRLLVGIATGGRKFGLSTVFCTQRPALIDKSVLAACNVRVFLRVTEVLDWDAVRRYMPSRMGITYDEPGSGVRFFASGEAVVMSRWSPDRRTHLSLPPVAPSSLVPSFL